MFRSGLLVVISGPSGAGKSTLLDLVKEQNKNVRFSVSATTRKPREGEINGLDYFFKSADEFNRMIENKELIEWVEYCGNYYGTPKEYVLTSIEQGYDVILEIEVDGAANIKSIYPDSVSIFILPPSFQELKKRIEGRGTENAQVIEERMNRAKKEIMYIDRYDYIVVNDNIKRAADHIGNILAAEKLRFHRNRNILENLGFSWE
ncbi:MAG: guanylate kinase [Clostridiales bacterium]|jgi:guanylate kinase|nr:guanylate kinase [Eubacteriales bacterium]MDH7565490.1 guanylate kinase [Clostridiales bacterium]